MDPVSLLILGGIFAGAKRLFGKGSEEYFVEASSERSFRTPLPRRQAARQALKFLNGELGASVYDSAPTYQIYSRGDLRIDELNGKSKVSWLRVPLIIVVSLEEIAGGTRVSVKWESTPSLKMTKAVTQFFHECAEREFRTMMARFEAGCASTPPPEEPAPPQADGNDDYAVLGLSPSARWSEVQAAYREACRRFHPDALAGSGIPQHLVDLAAEQFKRITAAYEALRRRVRS